jgi:hypothetical protein
VSRWGRGWEVGINAEIHKQQKATARAAAILARECGMPGTLGHKLGERADLCPKCIEHRERGSK